MARQPERYVDINTGLQELLRHAGVTSIADMGRAAAECCLQACECCLQVSRTLRPAELDRAAIESAGFYVR
jgi:hypothetical protein